MYKDKEQQKEANKLAAQRRRDKAKGMTGMTGMTKSGYDAQGMTDNVPAELPSEIAALLPPVPEAKGKFKDLPLDVQKQIEMDCAWLESKGIEPDRKARIARALHYHKLYPHSRPNPIITKAVDLSKPGDADYKGVCSHHNGVWATT